VEQYIEGYYCRNDFDLETLNKGSNRKILEALHNAYPSGLTVKELAHETGLPEKTIYPQIKSLIREHFIKEVGKEKQSRSRGRPGFKNNTEMATQRAKGQVIIENATRFFDAHEEKDGRNSPLPPGYVEYFGPFLQLWGELAQKEELEELTMVLVRFIKKMVTKTFESEDDTIGQIRPRKKIEFCCSQCGLNHEARDFIRSLSLCLIDEVEKSEPYLYFLKENNFITEEAFKHALAKIPKLTKPPTVSLESFRKTAANFPPIEDIEGIGPSTEINRGRIYFSQVFGDG
jgi:predicted ArsR family transcriptional regulator